jgi:hypothetical protein
MCENEILLSIQKLNDSILDDSLLIHLGTYSSGRTQRNRLFLEEELSSLSSPLVAVETQLAKGILREQ